MSADYPNSFNALMEFESGATGVLLSSFGVGGRVHAFEMHSRRFSAYVNPNYEATIYDGSEEPVRLKTQEAAGSEDHHKVYGFFDENRHFVDCVKAGTQPMTSFRDALKTMELVDRIYASEMRA